MAPPAAMSGELAASAVCGAGKLGSDFRYVAIALMSSSVILDVDRSTASAIGPVAAVMRLWPVFRYAATSSMLQLPRPVRASFVMFGADHPWSGAPWRYCAVLSPPRKVLGVWQAPQCAGPSTRNAPRFHSADFCGSATYSPSLKYSPSHIRIDVRMLNGNGSVLATTGL